MDILTSPLLYTNDFSYLDKVKIENILTSTNNIKHNKCEIHPDKILQEIKTI